jgi:hypothetical protein
MCACFSRSKTDDRDPSDHDPSEHGRSDRGRSDRDRGRSDRETVERAVMTDYAIIRGEQFVGKRQRVDDLLTVSAYGISPPNTPHLVNYLPVNSGTELYRTDLNGTELCRADPNGTELCRADPNGSELCRADPNGSELCRADPNGTEAPCFNHRA